MTPEWNVIYYNINSQEIQTFNIFKHGGFYKDTKEYLKECKTKEEFADRIKSSLMYYFWLKSEWEVLIYPWTGFKDPPCKKKVDVFWQVRNNWQQFIDYTWGFKHLDLNN